MAPTYEMIQKWIKENNIPIKTRNRAEPVNRYFEAHPCCMTEEEYYKVIQLEGSGIILTDEEIKNLKKYCTFCRQQRKREEDSDGEDSYPSFEECCSIHFYFKKIVYGGRITRDQKAEISAWKLDICDLVGPVDFKTHNILKIRTVPGWKFGSKVKKTFPGFYMGNGIWKFLEYLPKFNEKGECIEEKWEGEYSYPCDQHSESDSDCTISDDE